MTSRNLPIDDCFEFVRNGMNIRQSKEANGLPVTRIETISDGSIDLTRVGYAGLEERDAEKWILQTGDILFSHINSVEHVGKCALYEGSPTPLVHGMNLLCLRPKKEILYPPYAKWTLKSSLFRSKILPFINKAVNQASLSTKNLKSIEMQLPPLDEQKRIAAILDQADALRGLRQRAIARLNTLGQAIFHDMFGDSTKAQRMPLGDVINIRSSLADPKLPEYRELPHVGPEHISSGSGRISWERVVSCQEDGVTSGKYVFEEGDIIYSKIRPYLDKVAIADRKGMCSADMYALNCKKEHTLPSFVHFALGTSDFLSYAAQSSGRANIPKINRRQLLGYPIPLPSLGAQREFESKIQKLEEFRKIAERHSRRTESLFASLQSRAFRGEL
ncbi:restriction endonuclease subunit S [Kiloniella litopenaei]|uniref:restriction endonuclease subunit S n=1 Tax=Kiloniella litopenaei TaxID=1549748 RepID=UPI0006969BD0|nr:restriction endonuclease subunit S [Kiloniella litopenaei]